MQYHTTQWEPGSLPVGMTTHTETAAPVFQTRFYLLPDIPDIKSIKIRVVPNIHNVFIIFNSRNNEK